MTEQEAIRTLKNDACRQCEYGASCMEECSIDYCDNREAVQTLMMAMDARGEKKQFIVRSFMDILSNIQNATCNGMVLQPSSESILDNATKVYIKQMELIAEVTKNETKTFR